MSPIGGHVQAVVEQVDRAGDQAEGHQCPCGRQPDVELKAEGEQRRGKDQQIFGPLVRTAGPNQGRTAGPGVLGHYELREDNGCMCEWMVFASNK